MQAQNLDPIAERKWTLRVEPPRVSVMDGTRTIYYGPAIAADIEIARLIAAAPALLALAQRIVQQWEEDDCVWVGTVEDARAALQAATVPPDDEPLPIPRLKRPTPSAAG